MTIFENTEEDFALEAKRAKEGRQKGFERAVKQRERLEVSATTSTQPIIQNAMGPIADRLDEVIAAEKAKGKKGKAEWYSTLCDLDTDLLSMLAISVCMDGTAKNWSVSHLTTEIGRRVELNLFAALVGDVYSEFHPRGRRAFNQIHKKAMEKSADYERRKSYLKHRVGVGAITVGWQEWSDRFAWKIGLPLLSAVLEMSNIFEIYSIRRKVKINSTIDRIGFTPEIQKMIDENNLKLDWNAPAYRPMVVYPQDWGAENTFGPYIDLEAGVGCPMVKNARPDQARRLRRAMKNKTMDECLRAVNTLQRVPYIINEYTLDALQWVKDSLMDDDLLHSKFPPLTPIDVPEETEENKSGKEAQKRWRLVQRQKLVEASHVQIDADLAEANSLREAPAGRNHRHFWLPHNFDTRGRVYHVPAFGHHRGDHVRGLFLFADKKPLTKDNLHMLYYQAATTFAGPVSDTDSRKTDKIALEERYKWVQDNIDTLMQAGKDFVVGFDHWSKAGEPFQHLAACRELYLANEYGDGYLCGLPIGFDGANSGLQHYAMASKWREDGYKVNLCKERADLNWPTGPQDCYQYIAEYGTKTAQEMVDGTRETFDNRDVSDQDRENAAVWLEQGITRKVTKRNTMTWSYSVTLIGMADQLRDEIMDDLTAHCDDHNEPHPFGDDAGFSACLTMAGINKDSIEAVIQSGAHGMAFLRKIARILAADGKHMQWTSLIGFPAAQQYQQEEKNRVRGFLHERDKKKRSYRSSLTEEVGGVDLTASLDGAAPNWVHHLDSTHLMMTVNKAKEYDVTNLMVVHDSFSTDVASAQVMLDCIRATMVEMYEEECHYTSLLNDSKLLHSDPNNVGPQADLDAIDIQIASETDDEALELLMEERENIKKRFVVWPEIPPKGEGDNAMDVFEILESDHAFA